MPTASSPGAHTTWQCCASPAPPRWVADEHWHPRQEMTVLSDGGAELRVPYGDPRELVMEIRRYGADVEVIGPPGLRRLVAQSLREAAGRYG